VTGLAPLRQNACPEPAKDCRALWDGYEYLVRRLVHRQVTSTVLHSRVYVATLYIIRGFPARNRSALQDVVRSKNPHGGTGQSQSDLWSVGSPIALRLMNVSGVGERGRVGWGIQRN
jgi:hypothetical protein